MSDSSETTQIGPAVPADMVEVLAAVRTGDALVESITTGLAGSLNLRRTALTLLTLMRPDLADWSFLVLPGDTATSMLIVGGEDTGFHDVVSARAVRECALGQLLRSGNSELIHVASGHPEDVEDSLSSLVPHPRLTAEAAELRPADIVGVALTARGDTYGALVMVRAQGRGFDDADVALAQRVCERAAVVLDWARLYEERSRIAAVLQRGLRPPVLPTIPGVDLAARYRPSAEGLDVGGDFYDVHGADDDWLMVLGDVCGKGVEAAAITGQARQTLRAASHFERHPAALLAAVNTVMHSAQPDGMFVTMVCMRVQRVESGLDLEIAVAGHPAPIILRRSDGRVEQLQAAGIAIGFTDVVTYTTTHLHLDAGDSLLAFTDGIDEASGPDGYYGVERLTQVLAAHTRAGAEVICEAVEQDVLEHLDGGPHDDIALLALTCR